LTTDICQTNAAQRSGVFNFQSEHELAGTSSETQTNDWDSSNTIYEIKTRTGNENGQKLRNYRQTTWNNRNSQPKIADELKKSQTVEQPLTNSIRIHRSDYIKCTTGAEGVKGQNANQTEGRHIQTDRQTDRQKDGQRW